MAYIAYKWWERRRFFRKLRMARISVDELYRLIDQDMKPVIVDVRSPTAYRWSRGAFPGRCTCRFARSTSRQGPASRSRDHPLLQLPNEASAAQVAKVLMNNGFSKVRPLHGGLDAWIAAGYPVDELT